ncbi:MAG: RDD family protein [bacterium]
MNDSATRAMPTALAPHHLRFFALLLDYLVAVILLRLGEELTLGEHWDLRPPPGALYLSPYWYVGFTVLMLCKDALAGRSPGKWLTGLLVAEAANPARRAGRARTLVRNAFLVLGPIEALSVFFDPYLRRLGDRAAGTVVVVAPRVTPFFRRWLVVAMAFLALLLASFLISPWNMRRSAAYRDARQIAGGHAGVARTVGRPFTLDRTPVFQLRQDSTREEATVTFQATGPRGTTEVTVAMRLNRPAGSWERLSVSFAGQAEPPGPPVRDAPPPPPPPSTPEAVENP